MWNRIKRNLLAGGLVFLPLYLTVVILVKLFLLIDGILNQVATRALVSALGLPISGDKIIYGLGFFTLLLILIITGWIARHYFGKNIIAWFNYQLDHIPVVNRIYKTIRQISEALLSGKGKAFQKPVLIEYPRPGLFTLVFKTQETAGPVRDAIGQDCISVFLPSTPNPTTGYLLFVPESQVIEVDLSSEDALKMIISGGVIPPERGTTAGGKPAVNSDTPADSSAPAKKD